MCFACVVGTHSDWDLEGSERTVVVQSSGDWTGRLWMQAPRATCAALASSFLAEPVTIDDADQADSVLGELANIVFGSMLGRENPTGHFNLAAPVAVPNFADHPDVAQTYELDCGRLRIALERS